MKAEKISILAGIVLIILLGVLIIAKMGIIGVSPGKLEQAARKEQNIEAGWQTAQGSGEDMSILLFYNEAKSDCRYAVYMTHEGVSYGYFLIDEGADEYIVDSSRSIVYEDQGIALFSLNRAQVCRIEVSNGAVGTVVVDPSKPFAVVLPVDCGEITLYDAQDQIISLYDV